MTTAADLAAFADAVTYADLDDAVVAATRRRLCDAVGVARGARETPTLDGVRGAVAAEGGDACTLWGADGATAGPSSAALHGTARVRASGYADAYLAPGGAAHPSDAVAACVAAAEHADAAVETLLAAVAAAYEVHGELAFEAPVREHGFGPATYTVVSAAVGASVALGLDTDATRDALGHAVAGHTALAVPGDAAWSGVASAAAARDGLASALLADEGVAGPEGAFEAHPAFADLAVSDESYEDPGHIFAEDETGFSPDPACERAHDVASRSFAVPFAAQSAVAVVADLASRLDDPTDVARLDVGTFDALTLDALDPDARDVATPAEAARSFPHVVAVALLDGGVGPDAYDPDRIDDPDVARLREAVTVTERERLTAQFEAGLMPAVADAELGDGTVHHAETGAFPGHPTQPTGWDDLDAKLSGLLGDDAAAELVAVCREADAEASVADLRAVLA